MVQIVQSKAMIVIISAPSGGGKTTISKRIIQNDNNIVLSISATTRKPRSNEKEAIHYFFKTQKEFQELQESDKFIEYAKVYGNLYGTPKKYVSDMLDAGKDVLFDIDHQGAQKIKERLKDRVISIFIKPPSISVLQERLTLRGENNEDDINHRLQMAEKDMSFASSYDYVVINDNLNETVVNIQEIIKQERKKKSLNAKK